MYNLNPWGCQCSSNPGVNRHETCVPNVPSNARSAKQRTGRVSGCPLGPVDVRFFFLETMKKWRESQHIYIYIHIPLKRWNPFILAWPLCWKKNGRITQEKAPCHVVSCEYHDVSCSVSKLSYWLARIFSSFWLVSHVGAGWCWHSLVNHMRSW